MSSNGGGINTQGKFETREAFDNTAPLIEALNWSKVEESEMQAILSNKSSKTPKHTLASLVRYHRGKLLIPKSALNHILP